MAAPLKVSPSAIQGYEQTEKNDPTTRARYLAALQQTDTGDFAPLPTFARP